MITNIIVSSPHAACPQSIHRQCDLAAEISAYTFCQAIDKYKTISFVYMQGDEFRANHDLNRKNSRNTKFRKKLMDFFTLFAQQFTIMIDIHSFPNEWIKEAGDINFFKKSEVAPEIVILEGPLDNYEGISLSKTLNNNLISLGVDCKIIRGIKVNDIINHSKDFGIPGVLLEFNEKFTQDVVRLKQICKFTARIIRDIAQNAI